MLNSRGTGVTVTTLCPGPVETGFAAASGLSDEEASDTLPKFMWVPAPEVARAAVAALDAGHAVIIPGRINRVAAHFANVIPKSWLLPTLAKQHPALKADGLKK